MYPKVYLKKEDFLQRKHPWVFSGALKITHPEWHNKIVHVCNEQGEILATGYYQNSSIAVKILSFSNTIINDTFWEIKLKEAFEYRLKISAFDEHTNAYRLVFAEADELPGLIIDYYNGHFVMQAHNSFIEQQTPLIHQALKTIFQDTFKSFFNKTENITHIENTDIPKDTIIQENKLLFYVNWKEGQKTGFYLDQKDNRLCLKKYSKNKVVLNAFAYSGGFSVYAAAGGCSLVHSVDSSAKAIEWCHYNMALNNFTNVHQAFVADAFEFLKNAEKNFYDIIVLDPPAFAKSIHHKHAAIQAYKRLNELALNILKPQGLLFTFSCSGVIDKNLFYNTIAAACFESQRTVRVLEYLHLPPDHPVLFSFPEGEYLKGLVLYVE